MFYFTHSFSIFVGRMEDWIHYYNEGIEHKEHGDLKQSLACHLKVFELEPNLEMPEAWHNVGAAYLRLNQPELAKSYLEQSIAYYDQIIALIRETDLKDEQAALYELQMNQEEAEAYDNDEDDEAEEDEPSLEELGLPSEFQVMPDIEASREEDFSLLDDDFPEFYENDRPAYYIFWKACAYALLGKPVEALETLKEAIEEDEYYAIEAENEEDLTILHDVPAFRQLVLPLVEKIKRPDHHHLFELFEQIELQVLFGFDHPDDCIEQLYHRFSQEYEEKVPKAWIKMTLLDLFEKHQKASKNWEHPTDVERLGAAFMDLWQQRIVSMHVVGNDEQEARGTVDQFIQHGIFNFQINGYCCYDKEQIERIIRTPKSDLNLFYAAPSDEPLENARLAQALTAVLEKHGLKVNKEKSSRNQLVLSDFSWNKVFTDNANSDMWDYWDMLQQIEDQDD